MLCLENELGWRLHKHKEGYAIRRAHPPLSSRVWQFGFVFFGVMFVVFVWVRDTGTLPYVLCAIMTLLLAGLLFGSKGTRRLVLLAVIPALLGILGLALREDVTIYMAPFVFMALLLVSWGFRPRVLFVNVRRGVFFIDTDITPLPSSCFKIGVDRPDNTQLYSVYLENPESPGKHLLWESTTEAEASGMADDLRKWGIGTNIAQEQNNVIKADKRARNLVRIGYIVAVVIFLAVMVPWVRHAMGKSAEDVEMQVALLVVKIIVGFLFLSILPLGLYLCRFGWRAIKHRQMPPPQTTVIFDTKILEGKKAVTRGQIMMALSVVLIALSLIGGLYFPYRLGEAFEEQITQETAQPAPSGAKPTE